MNTGSLLLRLGLACIVVACLGLLACAFAAALVCSPTACG